MFTTAYAASAAWNDTFWKNPRFNELLVAARAETDEAKRAGDVCRNAADSSTMTAASSSWCSTTTSSAHTEKLAHGDIAANWEMDGLKIAARWWFA